MDPKPKILEIPSFREWAKSLINWKDWDKKTPFEKWSILYGIGRTSLIPTGFTSFVHDQTLLWYSYAAAVYIPTYFALAFYTIFYHLKNGEMMKCLPCTVVFGLLAAGFTFTFIGYTIRRYEMHSLAEFGGRYIYRNDREDIKYNEICSEHIDSTIRQFFIKMTIILLSFNIGVSGIFYALFVLDQRPSATGIKFPFIAEGSDAEYITNMVFGLTLAAIGMPAFVGIEVLMTLFCDVPTISPKLAEYELNRLDDMVIKGRMSESQIQFTLRRILKRALDTDDYLIRLRNLLYFRELITPSASAYMIAMAIFLQYTGDYVCGYDFAIMAWVQLFYICEVGEYIENDGFDKVFYKSKWYKMPIKNQKNIRLIIFRKQNGVTLTRGPFGNINRELFKNITNSIYSMVMFLLRLQ